MDMKERLRRLHENTEGLAQFFLERAKDGKGWQCPCGHGSGEAEKKDGKNYGDGIQFTATGRWHCFSCQHKGDIVEIYQYKHGGGLPFTKAVEELEGFLGILPEVKPSAPAKVGKSPEQVKAEFSKLIFSPLEANFRGISPETLARYGAKMCKAFRNPLIAGTYHGAREAVAFPTSGGCYFVRAVEHSDNERTDKWDIGGKMPFNLEALKGGKPVFVCEGVLDALSIIEAGGEAVALSGTDGIKAFVAALKESPFPNGLLLAADNDEPGQKAAAGWKRAIEGAGASCKVLDVAALYAGAKDANEALQSDADGLQHRVAEINAAEMQVINPWAAGVAALVDNVEAGVYEPIPTGIESIDTLMGGGFVAKQLVILGAAPGMGKTAFCQQLTETMATSKADFSAMYFCFEMAREQLQARSISRLLHGRGIDLSPLEVMQGKMGWREGVKMYEQEIAGKVAYYGLGSGLHSSGLEEVLALMREGVRYNALIGKPAPIVVVDYLQLIDVEGKDEQEALKVVVERLKEFAIKHNTVVIGIVANNRESNKAGGVSMYSGRGSSSIEYGADVVMGLAYTELLDKREEVEHKNKRSLVMTKGRFYQQDARADFDFNGKYSEFIPVESWGHPASRKDAREYDALFDMKPQAR